MVIPIEYGFPIIGLIVIVCIGYLIYEHFKEKKRNAAKNTNDNEQNKKFEEHS